MKEKKMGLAFNAVIRRLDHNSGKILDEETVHNIVTNDGLERIVKLLGGLSSDSYNCLAIGEDNTAELATDTALGTEVQRQVASISYVADYKVKYEKVFTFGSGDEYTIVEAGIFDDITPSGSIIFNRLTFTGKSVDINTDLSVTITVTGARV